MTTPTNCDPKKCDLINQIYKDTPKESWFCRDHSRPYYPNRTTPTISEKIDRAFKRIEVRAIRGADIHGYHINEAKQDILREFADFAEHITPEKMELVEYKHRGLMDLTETSLSEATHNLQAHAHNACVDEIKQNTKRELGL